MTLHAQNEFSIPEETARVARAAYPKGNLYMKMRDALGTIYQDESFAHLFPQNGRPVEAPWRLAFITVAQFLEELPDRQAAEAVRGRIDLKYALGLELTDPGFDFTILTDFRTRLVQGGAEQVLLDAMLILFKERGWLKERQQQRTDSTHILAKIRALNRLMCVGETMRFALNSLAIVAGDWLLEHSDEAWLLRYGHRMEERRFSQSQTARLAIAETIGQAARKLQTTKEFSKQYALRQGIEATISQGVRAFGLRRSRYIGLDKTHLQHVGIAAAINLVRVVAWLDGDELAPTRVSAFQRLYAAA